MQASDLARLAVPSDPQISPDGTRVAFVVSRPSFEQDRYNRSIWIWDGESARPFTHGPSDSNPRWSPDGEYLAFLRGGETAEQRPQAAVMPAGGGEGRTLTEIPLGCEELEWSPDGSALAVVGVTYVGEWADLSDEERARKPRRLTDVPFRFDNMGWTHDRRRHVWLVGADGDTGPRCLTEGEHDERFIAWRPDGSAVAFYTDRSPRRAFEDGSDLFEVDVKTGELRRIADRGSWAFPTFRPDGRLHAVGDPVPGSWPHLISVWRFDSEPVDLTGHLDRNVYSMTLGVAPRGPQWHGTSFFSVIEDAGRVGVVRVHENGAVDHLVDGDRAVKGLTVDGSGRRLAMIISSPTDPGEVYLWEDGEERCLTDLNAEFRALVPMVDPEHFQVVSGGIEVDAWAYVPPGEERVPVLLNIHGGPASQYGWGFFDEFQVYAGAGYAVVACNPRGSTGRGLDHVRAVVGDGWGVVDVEDVTSTIEEALRRYPRLDPERIGVMGGSYGGFLTAWLIARDHRYASAVVERALLSFTSFAGTSDIGATFPKSYAGVDLVEDPDILWQKSPLAVADQIQTPTLILHSENDFRCPIEQAEQLFMILKRQEVETEFLRFPGEGHELSRSGKPKHRQERFDAILDWHGRKLTSAG
ncbi:MAG TPA: S9 family peptidase [Acidimicrobiia bacterium]|nr:S9 family peptidase [Acidimicrobiia bacterium]